MVVADPAAADKDEAVVEVANADAKIVSFVYHGQLIFYTFGNQHGNRTHSLHH